MTARQWRRLPGKLVREATDRVTAKRPAIGDTQPFTPSPVRPLPLADEARVTEILDVAVRVGEINLGCGMGASDTASIIEIVAAAYGLHDIQVDVTYNSITATVDRGPTKSPVSAIRVIKSPVIDFHRLEKADLLVRRIRRSSITPAHARAELDHIAVAEHPHRDWVAGMGWAIMAGAAAVMLGGNVLVGLISFVTTIAIQLTRTWLDNAGLPKFFQQAVGGMLATIPALVLYNFEEQLGISLAPSTLIAAGVIVLLAGLSLVGAVQDAITRYPVTAAGRAIELVIMTGGIIAGVAAALRLAEMIGLRMPVLAQVTPPDLTSVPVKVVAGAVMSAAFAVACYAHRRSLGAAAAAGAIGTVVQSMLLIWGLGTVAAASIAATLVGFIGGLLARRALTPPLIIALAGVTPLLPGLAIYRGLFALMNEQHIQGISSTIAAIAIATALAAGVTLGEWLARKTRRPRILRRASEVAVAAARNRRREAPVPYMQRQPLTPQALEPVDVHVADDTDRSPEPRPAADDQPPVDDLPATEAQPSLPAPEAQPSLSVTEASPVPTLFDRPQRARDRQPVAKDTTPVVDTSTPPAPIGATGTAYSEHPYMRAQLAAQKGRASSGPPRRR